MSINEACMNSQTTHRSTSLGKIKKGAVVALYIADYLKFKRRHDLEYFDSEMESLFIEIEGGMFLNVT